MSNINAMMQTLLGEQQAKADAILAQAHAQAQEVLEKATRESEAEHQRILAQYQARANDAQSHNELHEKMQRSRAMLSVREELVDEVLKKVHDRFINQQSGEWLKLLQLRLAEAEDEQGMPSAIIVSEELCESVSAALGQLYTVKAGNVSKGFIFSYPLYDINFDLERIFTSQQDELQQLAAKYLFDGDDI